MMRASNWKAIEKNTLRGFFSLHLQSGLVLHGCTFHRDPSAKEWVGLPGAPQIQDGRHRTDPATGKPAYTRIVEIPDKATRARFQTLAIEAVHALVDGPAKATPARESPSARTRAPRRTYSPRPGQTDSPALPDDPLDDIGRREVEP